MPPKKQAPCTVCRWFDLENVLSDEKMLRNLAYTGALPGAVFTGTNPRTNLGLKIEFLSEEKNTLVCLPALLALSNRFRPLEATDESDERMSWLQYPLPRVFWEETRRLDPDQSSFQTIGEYLTHLPMDRCMSLIAAEGFAKKYRQAASASTYLELLEAVYRFIANAQGFPTHPGHCEHKDLTNLRIRRKKTTLHVEPWAVLSRPAHSMLSASFRIVDSGSSTFKALFEQMMNHRASYDLQSFVTTAEEFERDLGQLASNALCCRDFADGGDSSSLHTWKLGDLLRLCKLMNASKQAKLTSGVEPTVLSIRLDMTAMREAGADLFAARTLNEEEDSKEEDNSAIPLLLTAKTMTLSTLSIAQVMCVDTRDHFVRELPMGQTIVFQLSGVETQGPNILKDWIAATRDRDHQLGVEIPLLQAPEDDDDVVSEDSCVFTNDSDAELETGVWISPLQPSSSGINVLDDMLADTLESSALQRQRSNQVLRSVFNNTRAMPLISTTAEDEESGGRRKRARSASPTGFFDDHAEGDGEDEDEEEEEGDSERFKEEMRDFIDDSEQPNEAEVEDDGGLAPLLPGDVEYDEFMAEKRRSAKREKKLLARAKAAAQEELIAKVKAMASASSSSASGVAGAEAESTLNQILAALLKGNTAEQVEETKEEEDVAPQEEEEEATAVDAEPGVEGEEGDDAGEGDEDPTAAEDEDDEEDEDDYIVSGVHREWSGLEHVVEECVDSAQVCFHTLYTRWNDSQLLDDSGDDRDVNRATAQFESTRLSDLSPVAAAATATTRDSKVTAQEKQDFARYIQFSMERLLRALNTGHARFIVTLVRKLLTRDARRLHLGQSVLAVLIRHLLQATCLRPLHPQASLMLALYMIFYNHPHLSSSDPLLHAFILTYAMQLSRLATVEPLPVMGDNGSETLNPLTLKVEETCALSQKASEKLQPFYHAALLLPFLIHEPGNLFTDDIARAQSVHATACQAVISDAFTDTGKKKLQAQRVHAFSNLPFRTLSNLWNQRMVLALKALKQNSSEATLSWSKTFDQWNHVLQADVTTTGPGAVTVAAATQGELLHTDTLGLLLILQEGTELRQQLIQLYMDTDALNAVLKLSMVQRNLARHSQAAALPPALPAAPSHKPPKEKTTKPLVSVMGLQHRFTMQRCVFTLLELLQYVIQLHDYCTSIPKRPHLPDHMYTWSKDSNTELLSNLVRLCRQCATILESRRRLLTRTMEEAQREDVEASYQLNRLVEEVKNKFRNSRHVSNVAHSVDIVLPTAYTDIQPLDPTAPLPEAFPFGIRDLLRMPYTARYYQVWLDVDNMSFFLRNELSHAIASFPVAHVRALAEELVRCFKENHKALEDELFTQLLASQSALEDTVGSGGDREDFGKLSAEDMEELVPNEEEEAAAEAAEEESGNAELDETAQVEEEEDKDMRKRKEKRLTRRTYAAPRNLQHVQGIVRDTEREAAELLKLLPPALTDKERALNALVWENLTLDQCVTDPTKFFKFSASLETPYQDRMSWKHLVLTVVHSYLCRKERSAVQQTEWTPLAVHRAMHGSAAQSYFYGGPCITLNHTLQVSLDWKSSTLTFSCTTPESAAAMDSTQPSQPQQQQTLTVQSMLGDYPRAAATVHNLLLRATGTLEPPMQRYRLNDTDPSVFMLWDNTILRSITTPLDANSRPLLRPQQQQLQRTRSNNAVRAAAEQMHVIIQQQQQQHQQAFKEDLLFFPRVLENVAITLTSEPFLVFPTPLDETPALGPLNARQIVSAVMRIVVHESIANKSQPLVLPDSCRQGHSMMSIGLLLATQILQGNEMRFYRGSRFTLSDFTVFAGEIASGLYNAYRSRNPYRPAVHDPAFHLSKDTSLLLDSCRSHSFHLLPAAIDEALSVIQSVLRKGHAYQVGPRAIYPYSFLAQTILCILFQSQDVVLSRSAVNVAYQWKVNAYYENSVSLVQRYFDACVYALAQLRSTVLRNLEPIRLHASKQDHISLTLDYKEPHYHLSLGHGLRHYEQQLLPLAESVLTQIDSRFTQPTLLQWNERVESLKQRADPSWTVTQKTQALHTLFTRARPQNAHNDIMTDNVLHLYQQLSVVPLIYSYRQHAIEAYTYRYEAKLGRVLLALPRAMVKSLYYVLKRCVASTQLLPSYGGRPTLVITGDTSAFAAGYLALFGNSKTQCVVYCHESNGDRTLSCNIANRTLVNTPLTHVASVSELQGTHSYSLVVTDLPTLCRDYLQLGFQERGSVLHQVSWERVVVADAVKECRLWSAAANLTITQLTCKYRWVQQEDMLHAVYACNGLGKRLSATQRKRRNESAECIPFNLLLQRWVLDESAWSNVDTTWQFALAPVTAATPVETSACEVWASYVCCMCLAPVTRQFTQWPGTVRVSTVTYTSTLLEDKLLETESVASGGSPSNSSSFSLLGLSDARRNTIFTGEKLSHWKSAFEAVRQAHHSATSLLEQARTNRSDRPEIHRVALWELPAPLAPSTLTEVDRIVASLIDVDVALGSGSAPSSAESKSKVDDTLRAKIADLEWKVETRALQNKGEDDDDDAAVEETEEPVRKRRVAKKLKPTVMTKGVIQYMIQTQESFRNAKLSDDATSLDSAGGPETIPLTLGVKWNRTKDWDELKSLIHSGHIVLDEESRAAWETRITKHVKGKTVLNEDFVLILNSLDPKWNARDTTRALSVLVFEIRNRILTEEAIMARCEVALQNVKTRRSVTAKKARAFVTAVCNFKGFVFVASEKLRMELESKNGVAWKEYVMIDQKRELIPNAVRPRHVREKLVIVCRDMTHCHMYAMALLQSWMKRNGHLRNSLMSLNAMVLNPVQGYVAQYTITASGKGKKREVTMGVQRITVARGLAEFNNPNATDTRLWIEPHFHLQQMAHTLRYNAGGCRNVVFADFPTEPVLPKLTRVMRGLMESHQVSSKVFAYLLFDKTQVNKIMQNPCRNMLRIM